MRTATVAVWLFLTAQAFGQLVPPPCGQQGVPNNVPCYDTKSAKVIHTDSASSVPHEDLSPWAKAALSGMYQSEPVELPIFKPSVLPNFNPLEGVPSVVRDFVNGHQTQQESRPSVNSQTRSASEKVTTTCHDFTSCFAEGAIRARQTQERRSRQKRQPTSVEDRQKNVPNASQNSSLSRDLMEDARQQLTLRPDDVQANSEWSFAVNVYCGESPDANYVDLAGEEQYCGGMARQAFVNMEQLRKDILNLRAYQGNEMAELAIAGAKSSWLDLQKMYCREAPKGKYIDLDGREQLCKAQ